MLNRNLIAFIVKAWSQATSVIAVVVVGATFVASAYGAERSSQAPLEVRDRASMYFDNLPIFKRPHNRDEATKTYADRFIEGFLRATNGEPSGGKDAMPDETVRQAGFKAGYEYWQTNPVWEPRLPSRVQKSLANRYFGSVDPERRPADMVKARNEFREGFHDGLFGPYPMRTETRTGEAYLAGVSAGREHKRANPDLFSDTWSTAARAYADKYYQSLRLEEHSKGDKDRDSMRARYVQGFKDGCIARQKEELTQAAFAAGQAYRRANPSRAVQMSYEEVGQHLEEYLGDASELLGPTRDLHDMFVDGFENPEDVYVWRREWEQAALMAGQEYAQRGEPLKSQMLAAVYLGEGYVEFDEVGIVSLGFENISFRGEQKNATAYWLSPYKKVRDFLGADLEQSRVGFERGEAIARVQGYLSPVGRYGHLGAYERSLVATKITRVSK